jgi:KaiC/GvpD/RAD55 family RecA-like ATPase
MAAIDVVPSGIGQLDKLLNGGFPKGRCVLVTGSCGTGKSIFGIQFLVNGITESGQNGILVTTEESPSTIKGNMNRFNWNLEKFEKEHKLGVIDIATPRSRVAHTGRDQVTLLINMNTFLLTLAQVQKSIDAKRVVLDSLPGLELMIEDSAEIRHAIHRIIVTLRELGCTTLLISEGSKRGEVSRYGVEEFVSDGVIFLEQIRHAGKFERGLTIVKMRGMNHEPKTCPYMITEKGITVIPSQVTSLPSALEL